MKKVVLLGFFVVLLTIMLLSCSSDSKDLEKNICSKDDDCVQSVFATGCHTPEYLNITYANTTIDWAGRGAIIHRTDAACICESNACVEKIPQSETYEFGFCTNPEFFSKPSSMNDCISDFFLRKIKDIQVCNQLIDMEHNKDFYMLQSSIFTCYEDLASATENASYCDYIPSGGRRDNCIERANDWSKGVAYCNDSSRLTIPLSSDIINRCYTDFAHQYLNTSYCDLIVSQYHTVANDELYTDNEFFNCVLGVAVLAEDADVCDEIVQSEATSRCREYLEIMI